MANTAKERVEQELAELKDKYEKLTAFIRKQHEILEKNRKELYKERDELHVICGEIHEYDGTVGYEELERLREQQRIMRQYIDILAVRLAWWKEI